MKSQTNIIGNYIKNARVAAQLTQHELSKRAGVSPSTMSRIESGTVLPTADVLVEIARTLDADLLELFAQLGLATKRKLPELEDYLREKYGCTEETIRHLAQHVRVDLPTDA